MKAPRRYRIPLLLLVAGAVVVAMLALPASRRPRLRHPSMRHPVGKSVRPRTMRSAAPPAPLYGPPSPPAPIYGPPTPPSRVPLLTIGANRRNAVLAVPQDAVRPAGQTAESELGPYGWETLDLKRGVPFLRQPGPDHIGDAEGSGSTADGRRLLFNRSASDASPVAVVYCLDPSLDGGRAKYLSAVVAELNKTILNLQADDRVGIVLAGRTPATFLPLTAIGRDTARTTAQRALSAIAAVRSAPLGPALEAAVANPDATHVVVLTSGACDWSEVDRNRLKGAARNGQAFPRIIALVMGDGTSSQAAQALRELAVATSGAFAWLKPAAARR